MNLWIPPFLTKAPFGSILSARIGQAAFGQAREGVRNGFRGGKCGACLKNRCFIGLQVLALYVSHSAFASTKVIFGWARQYGSSRSSQSFKSAMHDESDSHPAPESRPVV
jgi:hypothetical protein